ncbi:hypothetical protein Golob_012996 [Gossypium lobatum]|uniref:Uncharacterized protein n=1 Tax=Gossypium lobatum TaxID=34289 RepID=A0A7J8LN86_9ROSI|nr:hypothetical protein [Gossypium lobatum]
MVVEESFNPFAFATQKVAMLVDDSNFFGLEAACAPSVAQSVHLLHHFKKNNLTVSVYLAGIKHLCDSLAGCRHHVSLKEHQSTILNGLPSKFDHVVSIIMTSRVPFDIHEITSALLDAKARQQAHVSHFSANIVETDNGVSPIVASDLPTYSRKSHAGLIVVVVQVDLVVERDRNSRSVEKLVILIDGVTIDMMMLQMRMVWLALIPTMGIYVHHLMG